MTKSYSDRHDQAAALADRMVAIALKQSKVSTGAENANYALGYVGSVLRIVAAQSNHGLQELETMVKWSEAKHG